MTLDEAIEHLERKYKEDDYSFEQPREWCFALQEWLEELREFRRIANRVDTEEVKSKNNSRFITWVRWFESDNYDVVENMYTTPSNYKILKFEGYCVVKKIYIIPTKEKFVELLDYINNKMSGGNETYNTYIEEFIKENKLKEEEIK